MGELDKSRGEIEFSRTVEEMSFERSKSFVTALQELKNLRPQLHSAAGYCEKSYLNSDQKQMVLENLKDYTVRALVNAIDHLGTVAFKLCDILDQQTMEISSMDLKLAHLNQQLLTCQTCTDKEGLRQQQLLAIIPRHHKHYVLPNSVNKKVQFNPHVQTDPRHPVQARAHISQTGGSSAKTLSWHLATETKSTFRSTLHGKTSGAFNLIETEDPWMNLASPSTVPLRTIGPTKWDSPEASKPLTPYRSFGHSTQREITRQPLRSRSVLSAFFVKQKAPKLKTSV